MTTTTAFDRIIEALRAQDKVVRATKPNQSLAQCPAHEDRNPSLSITQVEGQVLIYCHAGCDNLDVMAALGLSKSDFYDNPKGATYSYDDGRSVHRTPDKRFSQSGNTNGQQTTLYRLDMVKAAFFDDKTIWLVEGEKDVHAIESLGEVATTAPMGAKNFHKVDVSPLSGAKVKAIVDDDDAGRDWQRQVIEKLEGVAASLEFYRAKVGKDAADHIAAGYGLDELGRVEPGEARSHKIRLTRASTIKPRPVRWTWKDRLPVGEVTLTPGKGGVGKSTFHAWTIAAVTRGTLPGHYFGTPKPVIIAATEDSWERTIVPRLIVAGADMDLVYRADVVTEGGAEMSLTLPRDCEALEAEIMRIGAVLLSLDPLMSMVSGALDTHKDRDVRSALEPLARLADRTGITVLGNAHFNKSAGNDPLSLIMGSAAFGNVVRAALGFARDPEAEDSSCVISQVKNNLGRLDLPSLRYVIEEAFLDTDEGQASVGKLVMLGESARSVADILRDRGSNDDHDERREVDQWLVAYLSADGGSANAQHVIRDGRASGFTEDAVKKARRRVGATSERQGFGKGSAVVWAIDAPIGAIDARNQKPAPMAPMGTYGNGQGVAYSRCMHCDTPLDNPVQRQRGSCGPCFVKVTP